MASNSAKIPKTISPMSLRLEKTRMLKDIASSHDNRGSSTSNQLKTLIPHQLIVNFNQRVSVVSSDNKTLNFDLLFVSIEFMCIV